MLPLGHNELSRHTHQRSAFKVSEFSREREKGKWHESNLLGLTTFLLFDVVHRPVFCWFGGTLVRAGSIVLLLLFGGYRSTKYLVDSRSSEKRRYFCLFVY